MASPEDDAPHDVTPGEEVEVRHRLQQFVVLHQVVARDLQLVHLQVGSFEIPYREVSAYGEGESRYQLAFEAVLPGDRERMAAAGVVLVRNSAAAISPGLDVVARVRNPSDRTVKLRVDLVAQEEIS